MGIDPRTTTTRAAIMRKAYPRVVAGAFAILAGAVAAHAAGIPDAVSGTIAVVAALVALHPLIPPYLFATVVAGERTWHGPPVDGAWDIAFLCAFAPYFMALCWFATRDLRGRDGTGTTSAMLMVGMYVCACTYVVMVREMLSS